MSNLKEKYIGEALLRSQPEKKFNLQIKDRAITTSKIQDKAVTPEKLADAVVNSVFKPLINTLKREIESEIARVEELQEKFVEDFIREASHIAYWENVDGSDSEDDEGIGTWLEDKFGDSTILGITQRALTSAIHKVWDVLDEVVTAEDDDAYSKYEIHIPGVASGLVHITVGPGSVSDYIESVKLYVNGDMEAEEKTPFSTTKTFTITVTETTTVECVVKVLGKEYIETKTIVLPTTPPDEEEVPQPDIPDFPDHPVIVK